MENLYKQVKDLEALAGAVREAVEDDDFDAVKDALAEYDDEWGDDDNPDDGDDTPADKTPRKARK